MAFLLLDPGLALTPHATESAIRADFWVRLIAWSTDRRAQLGPESYSVVLDHFKALGWPSYEPPHCPLGLGREARIAVNRVLSRVVIAAATPDRIPDFDPPYVHDENARLGLAMDVASPWDDDLIGIASHASHWTRPCNKVTVSQPPPSEVTLVFTPHAKTSQERDIQTRRALAKSRIHIVGGRQRDRVVEALKERFAVPAGQIEWIETEVDREPNLDSWKNMRSDRDIAICVVGCEGTPGMGHAASERARQFSTRRGVPTLIVVRPNEIIEQLQQLLA